MTDPASLHEAVGDRMHDVLVGNESTIDGLSIALLTRGHVLLEGVPGIAKTTMARLFGRATGCEVSRIQMTPDILPADITGTAVYREETGEFALRKGPVFANIVIADEINRATPKTQSALLEAMQELQVTIDGDSHPLPDPFMVVATQNPIEMEGTFELPTAQRDRFQQKLTVTLPDRDTERDLLNRFADAPSLGPNDIEPAVSPADITAARTTVDSVHVAEAITSYVLDLVAASRDHTDVTHGASPRAAITLLSVGKAHAAINGRDYVIPDDIKGHLESTLAHRLVLTTDASIRDVTPRDVVREIADRVPTPSSDEVDPPVAE